MLKIYNPLTPLSNNMTTNSVFVGSVTLTNDFLPLLISCMRPYDFHYFNVLITNYTIKVDYNKFLLTSVKFVILNNFIVSKWKNIFIWYSLKTFTNLIWMELFPRFITDLHL